MDASISVIRSCSSVPSPAIMTAARHRALRLGGVGLFSLSSRPIGSPFKDVIQFCTDREQLFLIVSVDNGSGQEMSYP